MPLAGRKPTCETVCKSYLDYALAFEIACRHLADSCPPEDDGYRACDDDSWMRAETNVDNCAACWRRHIDEELFGTEEQRRNVKK